MSKGNAVIEVLKDYKKHMDSYPGDNYWSKRFEMAFEYGCPCRFDINGILTRKNSFPWCPLHGNIKPYGKTKQGV